MKASEALIFLGRCDSAGSENPKKCCNDVSVTRIIRGRPATFLLMIGAVAVLLVQLGVSLGLSINGDIRVDANIPKEAELGKSTSLECYWKLLGNNSLYSVKWYKDEYEFFSFNPDNEPDYQIKTHPQNGVTIDVMKSNKTYVRLIHLTLNSSGQYKCEVSTGAPFFALNYVQGNLTVIALPSQGPVIRGLASYYAVGENVTANCSSWPSVPKAKLYWTINNRTISAEHTVQHPPQPPVRSQGTPNSLGLRLELNARHFAGSGGVLRIRCVAKVGSHRFEAEQRVQLVHANNQRISAGDLRSRGAAGSLIRSIFLIAISLVLTT